MQEKYDLILIGMGPSSIFCVYELLKSNFNKKILMIEKRTFDREKNMSY